MANPPELKSTLRDKKGCENDGRKIRKAPAGCSLVGTIKNIAEVEVLDKRTDMIGK